MIHGLCSVLQEASKPLYASPTIDNLVLSDVYNTISILCMYIQYEH